MKSSKTVLLLPLTLLLGASMVFGGCSAAKKPNPAPETPAAPGAATPAQNYPRAVAERVAAEANKVKDVRGATAVISGKNIYLGLDLDANVEKGKRAAVEKTVLNRVKDMEPNFTVSVTSDVDTVTRIKKVARGITQGKTISTFDRELKEIGKRLSPKTQ